MTLQNTSLSELGRNTRTMARRNEISIGDAVRRIKFQDHSIAGALDLALEAYEREPDALLLETIGDLYVSSGQRVAAENIFKAMHAEGERIHVTNLIYAGIAATRALVDDDKKILFIAIPKCGSSTVKNYFTKAIYGHGYKETVHFQHPELYRIVTAEEMRTTYKDYFRFSIIRDPLDRLVSYFAGNVTRLSLRNEAMARLEFMGLPTKPGPRQFAMSFHQYRQFFKDFRHHTDPIHGYLDPFRRVLDKIYGMDELPKIRKTLSDRYDCALEDDRSMVSKPEEQDKKVCAQAVKILKDWYGRDYTAYF